MKMEDLLHLKGCCSCCSCQQLMAKADTKYRLGIWFIDHPPNVVYCLTAKCRITWTVTQKQTIIFCNKHIPSFTLATKMHEWHREFCHLAAPCPVLCGYIDASIRIHGYLNLTSPFQVAYLGRCWSMFPLPLRSCALVPFV